MTPAEPLTRPGVPPGSTRKMSVAILLTAVSVALVMTVTTHVMLTQIHAEAVRQATRQQESSMMAFWEQIARRGRHFHVENGNLIIGDYCVLNDNNEIPDKILSITGSRATVFLGDVRIATNVVRPDGSRAIGTRLTGPAHEALFRDGTRYRGEADILGTPYFTAYDPIRDAEGKIIGALFVGVKQEEYLARYDWINTRIRMINGALAAVFVLLAVLLMLDRRRSENAIQKQLEFQQLLMDTIPSPIFAKDAQGRYTLCNKAFQSHVGLAPEELVGKTVFDLWSPELAQQYFEMDRDVMETPGVQVYESQVRYADGTLRDVIFHKAPFHDEEGAPAGLVGVILDITERKAAEAESSRLEAQLHHTRMVESLLIQLNHDLNTPLTPLFALLPMIRKQVKDPGLERMLDICQECSSQIKGLAGKSLDLVRLSTARPALRPVNLARAADAALDEVTAAMRQREIYCSNEIDPGIDVLGAEDQLHLLFKNLLSNAARYAAQNGRVRIRAQREQDAIRVSVQDDGVGLGPEQPSLIFDAFYKGDQARHDLNTQGLGLAICRRIMANHEGRIWAESLGKGAGTTIFFTLRPAGTSPDEDTGNYQI